MRPSRSYLSAFTLLVLAAPVAAGSGFVSDDFDRVNLDLGTWTFVNPLGDGRIAMVGPGSGDAHLALSLPAGTPHDVWGSGGLNEVPRVTQAVSDADFELEVKFNAEPTSGFNDQGLVVEQDPDNLLRFDVYHTGSLLKAFIGRTVGGSNTGILNLTIVPGSATYLRVRRTNDLFEFEHSGDGSTWFTAGSVTQAYTISSVSVYAGNPVGAEAYTAEVDYVFETALPVIPEDGGAPPDTDSPLIHSIDGTAGLNQLTVDWFTDEPCLGTVEYGETLSYELGQVSDAGGLSAHSVLVTGLQTGVTYHYRVLSDDGINPVSVSGDFTVLLDPTGPLIEVWYGLEQTFGAIGLAQPWANILGRVSDPDGVTSLSYTLNGGAPVTLSIGPDGRRLENAGDFNVDLALADLDAGANAVEITAVDGSSNVSVRTVIVNYDTGNVWPLPYSIDWGTAASVTDKTQAVDGLWSIEGIGARTTEPGYDRLLGFGHTSWDDYEVEVPITMNSLSPSSGGVGILMRWDGHTDFPIAGTQPKSGYLPLGCIGWYRNGRVELFGNGSDILDTDPRVLTVGLTYRFKMRVETNVGVGAVYKLKVWEDGMPEPAGWDVEGQEQLTDPQRGSCLLISHQYDVTFGDVVATPVAGPPNVAPVAIDDAFYVQPAGASDVDVLANDVDSDGTVVPITVAITVPPVNGSLFVNPTTGRVTYTHDGSATTTDTFRYTVEDNDGALSNEAVVTATITTDPPPPFESDDFNCGFDPTRWTFVNPLGDGSFALVGTGSGDAHLELTLPAGTEHDAWGPGGVNQSVRVMQSGANTDFELLVKWNAEPTGGFNDQGVIVEEDASNWLRFDVFHDGTNLKAFLGRRSGGTNTTIVNSTIAVGSATHARIVRAGSDYTFELSNDGASWALVGGVTESLIVAAVGLYAANPVDALAFTSEADFFFDAADPIVPEDGAPCTPSVLELVVADCQDDADLAPGYQIEVELQMLDLQSVVAGFAAFVDYDMGVLTYRGDLSSYTSVPFPLHISPILQGDDGRLELDGSLAFGSTEGTLDDALLATLVFNVLGQCEQPGAVTFETGGAFPSELSFGGDPLTTALIEPGSSTFDDTPPVIGTNANIVVPADAGLGCVGAVVTFSAPLATDDCTALPSVDCVPASGSTFPVGTTAVTCTATDDCGNVAMSTFDVTVEATHLVDLTVSLVGVTGPVTRCIHFQRGDCMSDDVELTFTGFPATFSGAIELACSNSDVLCAKDEQHTLWDTVSMSLSIDGTTWIADLPLVLHGGDTDNDGDSDINDITWFLFQLGGPANAGGCPWDGSTRDADFSNNTMVGSEDYAFFTSVWLTTSGCACSLPLTAGGGRTLGRMPGSRFDREPSLEIQAATLSPRMRAALDRDGDGVVDYKDVRSLEELHDLPHTLSSRLEAATRGRRK